MTRAAELLPQADAELRFTNPVRRSAGVELPGLTQPWTSRGVTGGRAPRGCAKETTVDDLGRFRSYLLVLARLRAEQLVGQVAGRAPAN